MGASLLPLVLFAPRRRKCQIDDPTVNIEMETIMERIVSGQLSHLDGS